MKYQLYKDFAGWAMYEPDDRGVRHTLDYQQATEAALDDWSEVLGDRFSDYHQLICRRDVLLERDK